MGFIFSLSAYLAFGSLRILSPDYRLKTSTSSQNGSLDITCCASRGSFLMILAELCGRLSSVWSGTGVSLVLSSMNGDPIFLMLYILSHTSPESRQGTDGIDMLHLPIDADKLLTRTVGRELSRIYILNYSGWTS